MNSAAYQCDGRSVSADAFYNTACDPQRSVVVEACAGAGKTWMLVSRMVRALLQGARPQEILAITFTRKAAGEMRDRLMQWLSDWQTDRASDETRIQVLCERGMSHPQAEAAQAALGELHETMLRGGRSVEIRTFHAWFSQLLRCAPLEMLDELQLSPNMQLLEEIDGHTDEIFHRFYSRLVTEDRLKADFQAQVRLRGRFSTIEWLKISLAKRLEIESAEKKGVLQMSVPESLGTWPHTANPYLAIHDPLFRGLLDELLEPLRQSRHQTLQKMCDAIEEALKLPDERKVFEAIKRQLFIQKGGLKKILLGFSPSEQLAELIVQITQAAQQRESHEEHQRMARLSLALIKEYMGYKRENGLADMSDLERCALALLRDSALTGWIQERLDTRIRHVLIDEFQDTSPLQWHALYSWLSSYAGSGGGFSGKAPLNVFIVGDPKQSIYRFRRADPRVFEAARVYVQQGLGGAFLACDHTRRNAPQVLEAVNRVFDSAQAAGQFHGFRQHTTALPRLDNPPTPWPASLWALPMVEMEAEASDLTLQGATDETSDAHLSASSLLHWRDSLTTPREEEREDRRQQEARQLARAMAAVLGHGARHPRSGKALSPGDIYVLARKRESLRILGHELHALGIPFAAPESMTLMDSPEVQDVVALLDFLASSRHHLSLARALKSPIFATSDADLIQIAQRVSVLRSQGEEGASSSPGRVSWWMALESFSEAEISPALHRARTHLLAWRPLARQLTPHDLLDHIFHQGDIFERMLAAAPLHQRVLAKDALTSLLGQSLLLNGARYATLYNLVRSLKRQAMPLRSSSSADAVQLLTVHAAKGLEAEVVFLMDTHPSDQGNNHPSLLVDWPIDSEAPRTCAFIYSEKNCPPSLQFLMDQEQAARQREELNGLYVAMTRAKECLVVSAHGRKKRTAVDGANVSTWWQRVSAVCTFCEPACSESLVHAGAADAPSRIWALPVLRSDSAGPMLLPSPNLAHEPDLDMPLNESSEVVNSEASRLGQAVHLVLQWATQSEAAEDPSLMVQSAAERYVVDATLVLNHVQCILSSPTCAPFFDKKHLEWAGNEVSITVEGRVQRIDRVVAQRQSEGRLCWWVLDYKLHETPQTLPDYQRQLLAYAAAIAQAQPEDHVRCAFITGLGQLVEVEYQNRS